MKWTFLVDDDETIWFHSVEKIITRIKLDFTESKLPNGISYWYNQETRLQDIINNQKAGNNSKNKDYYYEGVFAHLRKSKILLVYFIVKNWN